MRIEILAIGSELVAGLTVDTNSAMLAGLLRDQGMEVTRFNLVNDEESEIIMALNDAVSRSEALIVTGGLGPTTDDRTRFAVAKVFSAKLIEDEPSVQRLEKFFKSIGWIMPENNRLQCLFPEGAVIIENPVGTARGFAMEKDGHIALFGPGVPKELEKMAGESFVPMLKKRAGIDVCIATSKLHSFGLPESELGMKLNDLEKQFPEVELAYSVEFPVIHLRLSVTGDTESQAAAKLVPAENYIQNTVGRFLFGRENDTLASVVGALLIEKKLTVSLAESCTAGMICAALTEVSGSSEYFMEGAVTYSNDAKIRALGVSEKTLIAHGAVSPETAVEMALGIREKAGTDLGFSVTGIAGPTGGTLEKPVGLVYMALAYPGGVKHWENKFFGDRNRVRKLTTFSALERIRRYCLGEEIL